MTTRQNDWLIRPPQPMDLRDGLALLLADEGGPGLTVEAMEAVRSDLSAGRTAGIRVAVAGQRVIGAVVSRSHPGRVAFVWPPRLASDLAPAVALQVATDLLRDVAAEQLLAGANVLQCLISRRPAHLMALPPADWLIPALRAAGYVHSTQLELRQCEFASRPAPVEARESGLVAEAYRPDQHADWVRLVETILEQTLDCPYLVGVRSGEDLLAALAPSDGARERWWWRVSLPGGNAQPAGVLLLEPAEGSHELEIAYLGVVPEARRRGVATGLLQLAKSQAVGLGRRGLRVAVDSSNHWATRLYDRFGFAVVERAESRVRVATSGTCQGFDAR